MKSLIKRALERGKGFYISNRDKYAILSDLHLGAGFANDNSVKNNLFIFEALKYYLENDYTVILAGDTFEIAENSDIEDIKNVHEDIMWLFEELYKKNNLIILRGNHDENLTPKKLKTRRSSYLKKKVDFLQAIKIYDYAVLNNKYCVCHGHQESFYYTFFNKIILPLIHIWGFFEKWMLKDPTSLSNSKDNSKITDQYTAVGKELGYTFICGHIHSVILDKENYFNIGAGIMPRCCTCGEIVDNKFIPYKWSYTINNKVLLVDRTQLG